MSTNLWCGAQWSHAEKGEPERARLSGQNLIWFRDMVGKISYLSDICIHRGGALYND